MEVVVEAWRVAGAGPTYQLVLLLEALENVALLIPHDGERRGKMVVLQHRRVVVQQRQRRRGLDLVVRIRRSQG